jgi:type VI secretion system protein ImpF
MADPQGLMPSILDRLIDPEASGTAFAQGYTVEQMTQAVLRDLEDLLNTRQTALNVPSDCTEVKQSIVLYGLPDLTSMRALTTQDRMAIGKVLETIVMRYEPRLRNVKATLADPGNLRDRFVRFHLAGQLRLDPAPEIAFETVLELTTGHSTLSRSGGVS